MVVLELSLKGEEDSMVVEGGGEWVWLKVYRFRVF